MILYTGEESLPGAWTLQPIFGERTSQNDTTLCRADPAAIWLEEPPPHETVYIGSNDQGSHKDSTGSKGPFPAEEDARVCERRSWTRTSPSYQPETIIWSDEPHGEDGGGPVIPYTAEDWSSS